MGYYKQETFKNDEVLIYSRKSQSDDPTQTVEDVLAKHEIQLQEYAERELGGKIPEENIYREVVSGESIEGRVEIKKVLARIEDPKIRAVLVIDPQRLGRPDLIDCGRLISSLRFTKTQVLTLAMSYDLENEMERRFFQDDLMRGRDFLDYIKRTMFRGREAAAKRGEYIARDAPYGYRKIMKGDIRTLEIVEDQAEIVRLMFKWRVEDGVGNTIIAHRLNDMGVGTIKGKPWSRDTVGKILHNRHYLGLVVFNQRKETQVVVQGEIKKKRLKQGSDVEIVAEGKHPAIIDRDTWDAVQVTFAKVPRKKARSELKNPYSGMLRCSNCGRIMTRVLTQKDESYARYRCPSVTPCFASVKKTDLDAAIIDALELSELPALKLKVQNNEGDAVKIQEQQLKKLEKQLAEYRDQEETQFELLEQKKYSQELFDRRNAALRQKMDDCAAQIAKVKATMPQSIDYAERLTTLQTAIDTLKDPKATPQDQNRILKSVVESIDYSSEAYSPDNPCRRGRFTITKPFTVAVKLKL